jgi:hypothetical protein
VFAHSTPLPSDCPQGAWFIHALGYRKRFLEVGVMELTEVELPSKEQQVMENVLRVARCEML